MTGILALLVGIGVAFNGGHGIWDTGHGKPCPVSYVPCSMSAVQTAPDTIPLRLIDAVRTALEHNLQLLSSQAETRAIEARSRLSRSPYDPIVNLGAEPASSLYGGQLLGVLPTGASYLVGSASQSTLTQSGLEQNELAATIQQPLFRGLGFWSVRTAIRASDEGAAAARARYTRARDAVVAQVIISYDILIERHRQEAIAERSLARAQGLLDAYTELRALSKITEVELITARLGATSRRAALLAVRRDRQAAQDALLLAVYGARAPRALPNDSAVLMPNDTALTLPVLPSLDSAMAKALRIRPDVEAARRVVSQAKYQAEYARNASLPTLNLLGTITSRDTAARNGVISSGQPRQVEGALALTLSRPLFNRSGAAERQRTSADEARARINLLDAENVARTEIRAAFRDIALGRERADLATEASVLARRQYEGERARLDLGLTDLFRVLQVEEQVAQVERAEAVAWLDLAAAIVRYNVAIGEVTSEFIRPR